MAIPPNHKWIGYPADDFMRPTHEIKGELKGFIQEREEAIKCELLMDIRDLLIGIYYNEVEEASKKC